MENKHIRPIASYRKANPELYRVINYNVSDTKLSKKQEENNFYWMYACFELDFFKRSKEGGFNKFCWKDENTKNNICTITEMGRLHLTGWYYNIENFTLGLCKKLYAAYNYKIDNNIQFNDLEFSKAIIHIRENIGYYYHNENELKIYLLKHFFEKEIQKLLPHPPEEYQHLLEVIDFLEDIKKRNLKKDPEFYYHRTDDLENYTIYLEELLESYGISYLSEEDFLKQNKKDSEEYVKQIQQQESEYIEKCNAVLLKTNLLT